MRNSNMLVGVGKSLAFAAALLVSQSAFAQDFPSRPVTLVVPYAAGGTTDVITRMVAPKVEAVLGQPVLVENRPGGGSAIAAEYVARADPDGHTLLIGLPALTINPSLGREVNYDVLKDFAPVAIMGTGALGLLVNIDQPFHTVEQLIAYAKDNPGELSYGSSGIGTSPHMTMELFKAETGIDMEHIPYQGGAPALAALMSGEIQLEFDALLPVMAQIDAGTIRIIAVSTPQRVDVYPDVPTVEEAGVPGFDATFWIGVLAPAETPTEVVAALNSAFNEALNSDEVRQRYAELATEVSPTSPDEFREILEREISQWASVVERAGLSAE